jgi:hypothetical protein
VLNYFEKMAVLECICANIEIHPTVRNVLEESRNVHENIVQRQNRQQKHWKQSVILEETPLFLFSPFIIFTLAFHEEILLFLTGPPNWTLYCNLFCSPHRSLSQNSRLSALNNEFFPQHQDIPVELKYVKY